MAKTLRANRPLSQSGAVDAAVVSVLTLLCSSRARDGVGAAVLEVPGVMRWHSKGMADGGRTRTTVRLPADVQRPFDVFLNAVPQVEGRDYVVEEGELVFERPLAKEKVGLTRWTSMVLGIAGSYGKDDSVDVAYVVNGERRVAAKLPFELG